MLAARKSWGRRWGLAGPTFLMLRARFRNVHHCIIYDIQMWKQIIKDNYYNSLRLKFTADKPSLTSILQVHKHLDKQDHSPLLNLAPSFIVKSTMPIRYYTLADYIVHVYICMSQACDLLQNAD